MSRLFSCRSCFALLIAKGAKSILEKLLDVVQTMADNRKIELKTAQSAVSLLTKLVEDRFLTKEDKLIVQSKNNENKNRSTISNEMICLKKNKKSKNSNQAQPKRKEDSSHR